LIYLNGAAFAAQRERYDNNHAVRLDDWMQLLQGSQNLGEKNKPRQEIKHGNLHKHRSEIIIQMDTAAMIPKKGIHPFT